MNAPQSTTQHQKLIQMFTGNWLGEETLHVSPLNPTLDRGITEARRTALGDFFVLSDHIQRRDSGVIFQNHLVFGWDEPKQKVVMFQFDSMGRSLETPALGDWEGDTLTLEKSSPMGISRYRYDFKSERQYAFNFSIVRDGQPPSIIVDGIFNRVEASVSPV